MAEDRRAEDRPPPPPRGRPPGGRPGPDEGARSWRLWANLAFVVFVVALIVLANRVGSGLTEPYSVPYSSLLEALDRETVTRVAIGPRVVHWTERFADVEVRYQATRVPGVDEGDLVARLHAMGVEFSGDSPSEWWPLALVWLLPTILLVGVWLFVLRRMFAGGKTQVLSFSQSRAKTWDEGTTQINFEDVAGVDEAVAELREVVDFLRRPERYAAVWARIPKGVLLVGPTGTGKTLLARATAGEAGVPFFAISGAEFVEMFVGVGAARVRDLFRQARERAPCIVFIDEIDTLGKTRAGPGSPVSHEEREQTLNQLLVEVDGFDPSGGVILMAATNRPDLLDPALTQPDRFDRQSTVDRPDLNGREAILPVHARRVTLDPEVDLRVVAARTPGFAGAQLANVINEAALLSVRRGGNRITNEDLEEAIDRVMAGLEHPADPSALRAPSLNVREGPPILPPIPGRPSVSSPRSPFTAEGDPMPRVPRRRTGPGRPPARPLRRPPGGTGRRLEGRPGRRLEGRPGRRPDGRSRRRLPGRIGAVAALLLAAGCTPDIRAPDAGSGFPGPGPEAGRESTPGEKSIAFYVGSALTADGSVLLGGFGHEPSSHWLELTPAREFAPGTRLEVGVTGAARYPGERIRIPQEGRTARFVTSNYSEFAGFPPPLTNGGLNEHGVAARTVWSPSRTELREMTPDPQRGLSYSDLARAVMERATSAREAARLVGELVEAHGYATYGGNSFLFADAREGWVVITYAGGRGLWAAERLGPEDIRVLYPGYIRGFPVRFGDDPDYMGSEHLVEFAVERGWFDPEGASRMDLHEVYGQPFPSPSGVDDTAFRHPPDREEELRALVPVSVGDMIALVRDPRWSEDRAGYGQVAPLAEEVPGDRNVLWVSVAAAVTTPMVPVYVGTRDVPPEYKQHRYMTKAADATFLDPAFAPLEATRSAYRTFKRLFYHTCAHPADFLKPVTAELEAFEAARIDELAAVDAEARRLLEAGDVEGARDRLTAASETWLLEALDLAEHLVHAVETRVRERHGIPMPDRTVPEGATWLPESTPMELLPGASAAIDRHHCYVAGLDEYPRRHGSYGDRVGELVPARDGNGRGNRGS